MEFFGRPEFEAAAQAVRGRTRHQPRVGIVLGSGLGGLADSVENADIIPYDQLPHWPRSTVVGHQGQLHIGELEGVPVMVMRGRAHYYEGYPMSQVTLPIRVMQLLGLEIVILTNAAGGVNKSFHVGDLMLITDHINLIGMTGANPLRGPNDETLGERFPDMSRVYDRELRALALKTAREADIPMQQGVYICLAGPSFETPADIRFLRLIGADAVGMSTVPEATVARHGGLRVMGISMISNIAIDDPDQEAETSHEEVLEAGKMAVPRLEAVLRGVLRNLSAAL
ncbi:MAG TPA: purine-nucleoside phosphorylase [Chloroflexi bacterium]|nr:purine-nucleoside phosphorylase [Chloroflexota bacterium]